MKLTDGRIASRACIEIPYNTILSKNRMWRHGRGRTYINPGTKAEINAIAVLLKACRCQWEVRKLFVHVMVYRPDMRADPVNFLDAILDGVKVATGVDDRYYSGSWDWKLDKGNPRIEIEVKQSVKGLDDAAKNNDDN